MTTRAYPEVITEAIPMVVIRVSKLNVSTAAFSSVPARIARRIPKPSVEKGYRIWAISSRLGSDRLKLLPFAAGYAIV
jgi:hypothetical protein